MTTLATDDFNRANGALGANWAAIDTAHTIVSNKCVADTVAVDSSRYSGVAFPNDQWAQVVLGTVATVSDEGMGPIVRAATGAGGDIVFLQGNTTETRVYARIGGGYTKLGIDGPSVGSNDVLYLEVQGTTLIAKKNGANICGSPIAGAGSIPASGWAGIWGGSSALSATADDFAAGDFAGGGGGIGTSFASRGAPRSLSRGLGR